MSRREFPRKVKRDRFAYCRGLCEACGVKLQLGRFHYDHDDPDWRGGEPTFENCRVLCVPCHTEKTRAEAALKAKADRIHDRRIGALTSRSRLQGRGFPKSPPQHKATAPLQRPLPPRQS